MGYYVRPDWSTLDTTSETLCELAPPVLGTHTSGMHSRIGLHLLALALKARKGVGESVRKSRSSGQIDLCLRNRPRSKVRGNNSVYFPEL